MEEIVIGMLLLIVWSIGWWMKKQELEPIIEKREREICDLRLQAKYQDMIIDKLLLQKDNDKQSTKTEYNGTQNRCTDNSSINSADDLMATAMVPE